MLMVKLFGPGEARYQDRQLPGFPQQQSYLLLCYLLLNKPYPHHRDRLASLFWSELSSQNARKCLSNTLWRLRQSLLSVGAVPEEYLFISEDTISFQAAKNFWLDVDIFEETITQYLHLPEEGFTIEQTAQLERAAGLYTGDLLEGVYDDWCLYDRERLRLLYFQAIYKLMLYHGLQGNTAKALEFGAHLLRLDNTQEKVHRQMMRLYWLGGDRSAALAQYKLCKQILREELNVRPMRETLQLYEQILVDQDRPAGEAGGRTSLFPVEGAALKASDRTVAESLKMLREKLEETREELQQIENLICALTESNIS